MITRAAVVIGVNKTGGLTPLKAAVSGAHEIESWLKRQGYDVTLLDDEKEPVTVRQVKEAVNKYLDLGTLEQLVLYFAGHGYLNSFDEIWLLSGAPEDPDEAIDQTSSVDLARSCNVPSIVLISDACRTNPPSLRGARVWGSSIFPNREADNVDVEVDRFFATRPGDPALELPFEEASKNYVGLFTEMLHQAHRDPDQSLTRSIRVGGQDLVVVPSRRLKEILPELVNEAAQDRSLRLRQKPQLRLECGDDAYIAQAEFTTPVAGKSVGPTPPPSLPGALVHPVRRFGSPKPSDVAADLLRTGSSGESHPAGIPATPLKPAPQSRHQDLAYSSDIRNALHYDPGFSAAMDYVATADRTDHFETQSGVQITGAAVTWAAAIGMKAEIVPRGGSDAALVRLHGREHRSTPDHPTSILLQFEDGAGTVLAGLPGYIAAVAVEEGRVVNISYVPSTNSPLWTEYEYQREHIESLRAMTAAAAREGLLASDRGEARRLADLVRQSKRLDPTLGLYACLAYASLGLRAEGRSVQEYMQRDLSADLFDVALLTGRMFVYPDPGPPAPWPLRGRIQDSRSGSVPTVPFCPMISQSWSYLRSRGIELPQLLSEAGRHRRPSLWTTFEREGTVLLRNAVERELPL